MTTNGGADLLATIVAATRRIVEVRRSQESLDMLMRRAESRVDRGSGTFRAALQRTDRLNVIAECKRRSPSRGVLRQQYDAGAIATVYEGAGAAAISVLTEPTFFDGSLEHLRAVSSCVAIPVLRKDFVVDEYQIAEAAANGADAVLLIAAALSDRALKQLKGAAKALGVDALVEVHDEPELDRALAAGADLVGVNNRNLRTLAVDPQVSARLIDRIPREVTAVAESGFTSANELVAMRVAGYRAFLVGERLMTSQDPARTLRELIGQESVTGNPVQELR
jgi:indole-3-glycerol phosphate synthase